MTRLARMAAAAPGRGRRGGSAVTIDRIAANTQFGTKHILNGSAGTSGSTDNPDVAVNPLSVLTPGILRQLFAPLVGFPSPQSEQQAVSPSPQAGEAGSLR